jgi:protein gp37
MSAKTKIEWTRSDDGTPGKTWNPVRGCSIVSPGCVNCYAMKQAHRRWVSAEPLIGPIDFTFVGRGGHFEYATWNALTGEAHAIAEGTDIAWDTIQPVGSGALDWVVVGGESGPGARPMDLAWARSIVQQCRAANVPVFVKQLGTNPHERVDRAIAASEPLIPYVRLRDRKGGDLTEWPSDLRVREYPRVEATP